MILIKWPVLIFLAIVYYLIFFFNLQKKRVTKLTSTAQFFFTTFYKHDFFYFFSETKSFSSPICLAGLDCQPEETARGYNLQRSPLSTTKPERGSSEKIVQKKPLAFVSHLPFTLLQPPGSSSAATRMGYGLPNVNQVRVERLNLTPFSKIQTKQVYIGNFFDLFRRFPPARFLLKFSKKIL